MQFVRKTSALTLILLLAGQVLVRPLHHHHSPPTSAAAAEAPICRFCHHAHSPTPAPQPGSSAPTRDRDDEDCSICRYLSLATLPTIDIELPPALELAESTIVEPVSASRLLTRLFDVRGPPLA